MSSMTSLLPVSILLAALALHVRATCGPGAPFALPITDVRVVPSISDSLMKGIPAKIGTPPQNIVLLPWAELNNSYIYDEQSDCDPSIIFNDLICQVRRGGYFIETNSTTFAKASNLVTAGGAPQEITTSGTELGVKRLVSTSLSGTESLAVASAKSLTLPIGIPRLRWDNGYTILSPLGLGSNSTYLNALVQAGHIPSRVWSIFWGRMWTDVGAMDGHVVLGGYDQEKVIGPNFTQPLDYSEETGCWTGMKVTISNLLVNFRNGTDFSILPRNSAIQTCIVPHRQLLLEAPSSIVDAFEDATQMSNIGLSFDLHWSARNYNSSFFDGDITFLLNNGLQVRIANSQFLIPSVDILRNGSRRTDKSIKQLLMNGVGDQPATLGRYFFTATYLMVDHDAKSFTMWQANPSTSSKLVPVSREATGDCANSGDSGTDNPGAGDADNSSRSKPDSGSNVGAIAGGVVGGVAVLVAVAVAYFVFVRRHPHGDEGNKASTQLAPDDDPSKMFIQNGVGIYPFMPHEVQGSVVYLPQGRPAELAGV